MQTAPPSPQLEILLAEDNPINQRVAVRILEKYGHRVRVAATGREVLDALKCRAFDVVLMDLQMPDFNGWETTAAIREMERSSGEHLPIIALTASAMEGDREKCLAAGMDDYVTKPLQAQVLLDVLYANAPKRHAAVPAEASPAEAIPQEATPPERAELRTLLS